MGIYIQQSDLEGKLGNNKLLQLTDPDGTGTIQTSIVNDAIAAAEGRFESYVRTRYQLPVPATSLVTSLCLDLAIFNLFRLSSTVDDGVYKVWQDASSSAIKTLEAISQGKAALDVPAATESATNPVTADSALGSSSKKRGLFTDEDLRSY
jgi:phage gp36-like protein